MRTRKPGIPMRKRVLQVAQLGAQTKSRSLAYVFFSKWPTQFDFLNPRPGLWPSDTLPNELVSQSWNPTQDGGLGEACLFPRWV